MISLVLIIAAFSALFVMPVSASSAVDWNISYSPASGNLDTCALPASAETVTCGDRVYINLAIGNSGKLKEVRFFVKGPGEDSYHLAGTERARNYLRYAYTEYTVGWTAGTLYYYIEVDSLDGRKGWTGEQSVEVVGGQQQATAAWTLPMRNAYHTWGTNGTSWGANCNNYGRNNAGGRNYHVGLDLMSNSDWNVYSASSGWVVRSGYQSANGNYVIVQHEISGKTVYAFYAHLESRYVSEGQYVSTGDLIGVAGNSGTSASSSIRHLHFAIVDQLWNGSYYGYATWFSGDKTTYGGVTYYNPGYVVTYGCLP